METRPPWWGHSKEHGWVVLDRDLPCNTPGRRGELMFLRCGDQKIFFLKRELWQLPSYQFAPNYARSLPGAAADEALSEIEVHMARWPELRAALQRQYQDMQDRAEEARRAEEKRQKALASERKKQQRAAAQATKQVADADADE